MATGRVAVGVLLIIAGVVWTLQGLGYVGGSFMTGATIWAVIGPATALLGVVLVATARRGS